MIDAIIPPITSERLELISIPPTFMEAMLANDLAAAEQIIGLAVPPAWLEQRSLYNMRLETLRHDPTEQQWLLRAVVARATSTIIGYIGFHTAPNPEYLHESVPGGIEIGYTIEPPFRRQGYASEACTALMQWATREHGVRRFVLSISPDNTPSLRIAERFGFHKIGSHIDEEDGPEDVFLLEV
jgi:RimJ/RimL family protein N-acetyltransferase